MTVTVENQPIGQQDSLLTRRDAAVAQLNERGYAIVGQQADASVMDRLIEDVRPWAERAERLQLKFFGGGIRKVESIITKSHAFVSLLADPLMHAITESILGPEPLVNGSSVFILE